MPLFSIIVPIYGVEKYINKCVDSILKQTFSDFELILVDDGSPDKCPVICDEYAKSDNRVKVIHKPNGGLVSARIAGAKLAIGEYVLCVDSDDWIKNNMLDVIHNVILQHSPDIIRCGDIITDEIVFTDSPCCGNDLYYNRQDIEKTIFPFLIENNYGRYFAPDISGKVIKRDLYSQSQIKVPENLSIGEDGACTIPCVFKANSIYMLKDCLYYYRRNLNSMTKARKPYSLEEPKILGEHFEKSINMDELDFKDQLYRRVVHLLFNALTTQFYTGESYNNTVKLIKNTLNDDYYKTAVNSCKFSKRFLKGTLVYFTMKYRIYPMFWLYSKLRKL